MTHTINDTVRCCVCGHKVEAARLPHGRFNLGIDGWLVGTADDAEDAAWKLTECLRMRDPFYAAPTLPKRFRDKLAAL